MNRRVIILVVLSGLLLSLFIKCEKDSGSGFNLNLYPVSKDIAIGEYMDSLIKADPGEYPILDPVQHADAYNYLNSMFQEILSSDELKRRSDFDWELTIIDKNVLNAFACPGGKLYFYTGIMKYLDDAGGFAGVLAHEIAHSDRRHATQQMTQVAGLSLVLSFLTGDDATKMQQIAQDMVLSLSSLKFSRTDEYEADEYSVKYLADTKYHAKGIARFFEQLESDNHTASTFEFLSTHPSDDNRLSNIDEVWQDIGSPDGGYFVDEWNDLKTNKLP